MRRIFVTGGAGFIGSNFVHMLLRETDHHVTVFDKFGYAANKASLDGLPDSRLEVISGDLADRPSLSAALAGHDLVVNFAAESHNDRSIASPEEFVNSNVLGVFNLLEEARHSGIRLHHVSTDEVFGDLELDDPSSFTELTAYKPSSPYSATKASGDHLVRAWVRTFGVKATISNCSNNYGPRQHVEKFIPRQITNLFEGGKPKLYGSGQNVRDWIHVEDHNSAVWKICNEGKIGETYLIGANGEKSNLEIVKLLNAIFGRAENDFEIVQDRPGHDLRYAIDSSKLRAELGWNPVWTDIVQGLEKTVKWYHDNESWWRNQKVEAESFYSRTQGTIN